MAPVLALAAFTVLSTSPVLANEVHAGSETKSSTDEQQTAKPGTGTAKSPAQQIYMDRASEKELNKQAKEPSLQGKATGKPWRKDEPSGCQGAGCGTGKDMGPGYDKAGRPNEAPPAPPAPPPPKD